MVYGYDYQINKNRKMDGPELGEAYLHAFEHQDYQNVDQVLDQCYNFEAKGDMLIDPRNNVEYQYDKITQASREDVAPEDGGTHYMYTQLDRENLAHAIDNQFNDTIGQGFLASKEYGGSSRLIDPQMAVAAKLVSDQMMEPEVKSELMLNVAQHINPDKSHRNLTFSELDQRLTDEHGEMMNAIANQIVNNTDDHITAYEQSIDEYSTQMGYDMRLDNPDVDKDGKLSSMKSKFLQDYTQGMASALETNSTQGRRRTDVRKLQNLDKNSMAWNLGQMTATELNDQIRDLRIVDHHQTLSSKQATVLKHIGANEAYLNMKDALTYTADEDFEKCGVDVVASNMAHKKLKQLTFGNIAAIMDIDRQENLNKSQHAKVVLDKIDVVSGHKDDVKSLSQGHYATELVQDCCKDMQHDDYRGINDLALISDDDKQVLADDLAQRMIDGNVEVSDVCNNAKSYALHESNLDDANDRGNEAVMDEMDDYDANESSLLHNLDLNAKFHDKNVELSPKEVKQEKVEQQLQHDEDSHKDNVKIVKHKRQKMDDGPEM